MDCYDVPLDRLDYLMEKLGLVPDDFRAALAYREAFVRRKDEFGRYFYSYFLDIPRTRTIIEASRTPERLEGVMAGWFESLFTEGISPAFMTGLWTSGVTHVRINLDQRFVNLGYAITRQFCRQIIDEDLPPEDRPAVLAAVDKMLDFCILTATDSFIACTSRCDREMIAGIAHQVRNPITVIGGNIRRLQRGVAESSREHQTYQMVLKENLRLERMMQDIRTYTALYETAPEPAVVDLGEAIRGALDRLADAPRREDVDIRVDLDAGSTTVEADPGDLEAMFFYLLENAMEAAGRTDPRIAVSSGPGEQPGSVKVEIFNTGATPAPEAVADLFGPFRSSKPMGTGFGLPIAHLAARRNLGRVRLDPVPGQGAVTVVHLPRPGGV